MQFATYKDKIWCDVIFMDASHMILRRPWLFDMDVILWGKSNTCTFNHEGQRIKLISKSTKIQTRREKSAETRKEKSLSLISSKEIEKKVINGTQIIILVAREVAKESQEMIPRAVTLIITNFADVFPKDLPNQLPPIWNIQHAIDLVPGATLSNLSHNQMNLMEHAELQRQVDKLNRGCI